LHVLCVGSAKVNLLKNSSFTEEIPMGRPEKRKKMCPCSWDKLCIPKFQGGLGIKDPRKLSHALAAKLVWRLIKNPSTLWALIWQGKYANDIPPQYWIQIEGEISGSPI
jgi:hypothetical protein